MSEIRLYAPVGGLAYGTAGATPIPLPMRKATDGRLAGGPPDWTPFAGTPGGTNGDVQVSIDGAAFVNVAAVPIYSNGRWRQVLSAAELTGKSILLKIVDQDGPAIQDELIEVQTYGNALAYYPDTYSNQLLPSALVGGKIDANVGAMAAGVVTAAAIATDAIDDDALAASAVTEITAGIAPAPSAATIAAAVWEEAKLTHTTPDTFGSYLDTEVSGLSTGGTSASEIAEAVWDENLAFHNAAGTAGRAMRLARAQAKGKWQITGDSLQLFDVDNTTLLATFAISPPGGPYTSRTALAEIA